MELISVRSIFREKEKYLDQTITIGGWIRSVRGMGVFAPVIKISRV